MKARVEGREAQIMATLHSMADHSAAPTLSSVSMEGGWLERCLG
jgi:hypothetical protein